MTNSLPNNYKLNARYTILHQIGQGGFGITYKAHDTLFDRVVCIKELFLSGNSRREESLGITSQAVGDIDFSFFKHKFLEEAQKLATFEHPNIVKVLEYFEANNTAYMVMEFVEGKNLKDYVKERNRLEESEALPIFSQLMDATKAIHEKSFLHRDIKPDNVLITPQGKAVLIDFGTAKFHDSKNDNGNTSTLVLLSHGYAPPEQYSGKHKKGNYTDIYALGATLYFMLTGEKPEQATDRTINELKPISAINPNVSKQVEGAVIKAMELIPSKRYQKVGEMEKGLEYQTIDKTGKFKDFKVIFSVLFLTFIVIYFSIETGKDNGHYFEETEITTFNKSEEERILTEKEAEKKRQEEANKKSGTFTDSRDEKTYKWVKIGNQVWMAENLAYKPIYGNYWAFDNDLSNVAKYGYLYDWETACKVCPAGWHLPSDHEWTMLTDYLGGEKIAGIKMKSTTGWKDNGNDTNESGFSGLPGGVRGTNGAFDYVGDRGYWWSSTEYDTGGAWSRALDYSRGGVGRGSPSKKFGFSVRCLRD